MEDVQHNIGMNGHGNGVVQERRIWHFSHSANNKIAIYAGDPYPEYPDYLTISEVRDRIERHVENGTNDTIVSQLFIWHYNRGIHLTEQECTLLGRSCQPLVPHLQKLGMGENGWTDLERSFILRHMSLPSSTIKIICLGGYDAEMMPMTIRTLSDESPASLCDVRLCQIVLASEDCQLLGQMISNKERALNCLILRFCSLPCLADLMTLIAGFVKDKIPSEDCDFRGCVVKDAYIPKHSGADYLEFGRIFGEFWQRRDGEPETDTEEQAATRLQKSAGDMLNYFGPMQRAGLSRLLPPGENTESDESVIETRQPRERCEWVEVLRHEAVIDRVDLLFQILLLNPQVCVLERECSEPPNHSGQRGRKKRRRN